MSATGGFDQNEYADTKVSNFLIDQLWDQIVELHVEHQTAISVYVMASSHDAKTDRHATGVALAPIPHREFAEMCARLAERDARVAEAMAAPARARARQDHLRPWSHAAHAIVDAAAIVHARVIDFR